jgi:hypothetical protein
MTTSMGLMQACASGCGTLIRAGQVYCDSCMADSVRLEAKRLFEEHRNRSYGVGEYARTDVGVVLHRETASDDAADAIALAQFTGRELIEMALATAGLAVVVALLGPWFCQGVHGIWHLVLSSTAAR